MSPHHSITRNRQSDHPRLRRDPGEAGTSAAPAVVPLLDSSDFPSPSLDARITGLALQAQTGDRAARDALFIVFQLKLDRMVSRFWHRARESPVWELADLRQEAYLAFTELIASWPGERSFTAYVLRCFRGRLIDAIRRMEGRIPVASLVDVAAGADAAIEEIEVRSTIDELTRGWPDADRAILIRHICDGESIATLASELGQKPRVAYSRLRAMRNRLRRSLVEELRRERSALGR